MLRALSIYIYLGICLSIISTFKPTQTHIISQTQLDRFRLHLPQGAPRAQPGEEAGNEEAERAYSQWVSFFLGFYSCLTGRHAWAAAAAAAAAAGGGGGGGEEEELLLLEGLRGQGGSTGSLGGGASRPMSAMYRPLDGSGGVGASGGVGLRSAASSVGPESEDEEEDDDDDDDDEEAGTGSMAPPDFLTDEDDASILFTTTTSALASTASSVSADDRAQAAAPPQPMAAPSSRAPPVPALAATRLALVLTLPFVEVKLLDRSAEADGDKQEAAAAAAVRGWSLAMHNVRVESIRGGGVGGGPGAHPSENVYQAHFGHFELRALGADGEPLLGRPALLRPMLEEPVGVDRGGGGGGHGHGHGHGQSSSCFFPKMLPRGVRDAEEEGEGGYGGAVGLGAAAAGGEAGEADEEAATAGGGASLLLRHLVRTDAVALKLHTFAYPPPPPPRVAGNLEARVARQLHLVADLPAWRGLARFLSAHTDSRCLSGVWPATPAMAYPLQPMPSGGVRNLALRAAGLTVRLPPDEQHGGDGRGFTLACGASSLVVSPVLPRSFLAAAADGDEGPTALDPRVVAAASVAAAVPVPPVGSGAGSAVVLALAPWRMQLTLGNVRLVASGEGEGSQQQVSLIDPVGVHLLVSIDEGAAAPAVAARRVVDGRTLYVPLDAAASLSISLACLGLLRIRLQSQVCTGYFSGSSSFYVPPFSFPLNPPTPQ